MWKNDLHDECDVIMMNVFLSTVHGTCFTHKCNGLFCSIL